MTTPRNTRSEGRLAEYLRRREREFILKVLRQHHGHNSRTARDLGVSRRALYDKMRDYGLDGEASAMRTEAGIMGPRKVELDERMMPKPKAQRPAPGRPALAKAPLAKAARSKKRR